MKKKIFWINVVAVFLIALSLRAPIAVVGPLTEGLGVFLDSTQIGLLGSVPPIAFGLVAFGVVFLQTIQAMVLALVCLIAGILIRSFMGDYGGFWGNTGLYLGTLILSSGIAIANVLLPTLIKSKFPKKIDLMMSLYSVVVGFSLLGAVALALPVLHWTSLPVAMAIWIVFPILALVFYIPQMNNGRLFRPKVRQKENQSLLKNMTAWSVTLFMGFQALLSYSLSIWFPQIVSEAGHGIGVGADLLLFIQFLAVSMSFCCPMIFARLSPKARLRLIIVLSLTYACGFLIPCVLSNYSAMLLTSIVLGIPVGGCFSIALMMISWKTHSAYSAMKLSAMSQGWGYLLGALGPYILGKIHSLSGSFAWGLVFLFFCGIGLCISGYFSYKGKAI